MAEAEGLIAKFDRFWVSDCGCRDDGDGCERSRVDLCLFFDPAMGGTGTDFKEVTWEFVRGIVKEARDKLLVARPFRYEDDKTRAQGICFCCDDCCWYFKKEGRYESDKGAFVERTETDLCSACGACVEVCYFGAREVVDNAISVARDECFGCGLCVDICTEGCITMVER